jgi:Helix-turn-helix of DDE superfamily endonuclease
MASVRFTDVQARPTEFLDLTSLTLDEFPQLVPPFEAAFRAPLAAWRLDGKPRTARRFTVYKNCPLPTPEDRLFFILVYLKTYALQVVQGRLFGMGQSKANSVDSRPPPRAARGAAHPRRCPCPFPDGLSPAPGGLGGRRGHGGRPPGRGARPHPRA